MADTPLPVGTDVSETIDGKEYNRVTVHDANGADAMGAVGPNPDPTKLLGRLKAIADAVLNLVGLTSSANNFFPIVPGPDPLASVPTGVYCGGAGSLVVKGADGTEATFVVQAGATLPIRPRYVLGSTSATAIVGVKN